MSRPLAAPAKVVATIAGDSSNFSATNFTRFDLVYEGTGSNGGSLFARTWIPAGTLLGCLTPGKPVALPIAGDGTINYAPYERGQTLDLSVEDGHLICLVKQAGPEGFHGVDLINHSCTPNARVELRMLIRAVRDLQPDEEITIDYVAGQITTVREGIPCNCRPNCPTVI